MSSSLGNSAPLLASGRSPAYWLREMVQHATWTDTFRYTCAWLPELIALQPVLNNGPLFGGSLALLATDMTRQAQSPPEAIRSTRARPARMPGSAKHERPFASNNGTRLRKSKTDFTVYRPTAVSALTHFPSETPSRSKKRRWIRQASSTDHARLDWLAQVDRQVDYSLLHQWAGEAPMGVSAVPAHRLPWVPVRGTPVGTNVFSRRPTRVFARDTPTMYESAWEDVPSMVGVSLANTLRMGALRTDGWKGQAFAQSWQSSLIEQTRRMLYHALQSTTMNSEYQPTTMPTEQEELLLPRQWATTIGETTAPLELLQHYAALPEQDGGVANGNERNKDSTLSSPTQESRIPAKLNTAESDNNHAETRQAKSAESIHALAQFLEGSSSSNPQTVQMEQRLWEQRHTEHVQRAGDYVEQIMPPVVASQLPPLITPQRIDIPPLPVAAATVKLGARAEMIIEEDLDMLAAKIKRILDDEARRHGIDV